MTGLLRFAVLLLAVLFQASVSPLFTLSGVQGDVLVIVLALLTVYSGPRTAMWAIPTSAILLAMIVGRAPGLILLAYLPLLPLLVFLETANLPMGNYLRMAGAVLATGIWGRTVLTLTAVVQGAEFVPGVLVFDVILPGIFLDLALLTLVYVPQRALRWRQADMRLSRGGYGI